MGQHLLLVDDDDLLRRSLAFNLEQRGYRVSAAASAEDALAFARREPPDLILLDIGLPGMDGLEALRQMKYTQARRGEAPIPVIFLTARRRELDEVLGLELGADDYLTKPFSLDVLLAHIKAVLRRAGEAAGRTADTVTAGDLVIDPAAHTARLGQNPLDLTPREFDLLYALAQDAGQVISTADLLARVWGAEFLGEPQVVYVHIRWLRQKLESDPNHPQRIQTVRGVGYKLTPLTEG